MLTLFCDACFQNSVDSTELSLASFFVDNIKNLSRLCELLFWNSWNWKTNTQTASNLFRVIWAVIWFAIQIKRNTNFVYVPLRKLIVICTDDDGSIIPEPGLTRNLSGDVIFIWNSRRNFFFNPIQTGFRKSSAKFYFKSDRKRIQICKLYILEHISISFANLEDYFIARTSKNSKETFFLQKQRPLNFFLTNSNVNHRLAPFLHSFLFDSYETSATMIPDFVSIVNAKIYAYSYLWVVLFWN